MAVRVQVPPSAPIIEKASCGKPFWLFEADFGPPSPLQRSEQVSQRQAP